MLLLAAALSAASALHAALRGGGMGVVIAAAMSWALLFALASATVRACRGPGRPRQASPVVAGAVGAALTVGVRGAAVLVPLLVLPLCIPVLIFGAAAVEASRGGLGVSGHFSLLGAFLLLALVGAPWATAAALRIAVE